MGPKMVFCEERDQLYPLRAPQSRTFSNERLAHMTMLDDNIALRDAYLIDHGLTVQDFGLNYCYPPIPSTMWDWYKEHKFGAGAIHKRAGFFLIYLNVFGEPYLVDEVPYGVVRFLGVPTAVPEGESAPKVISQWGRRSEIHFEPIKGGVAWESLPHGSKVIHCESLIKAKAVHKYTGIPCIGYNGVNGFSSARQGVELIHEYAGFAFDKMDNVILFDSDVHTNVRVAKAREQLSHKLRHIANAPLVSWADLPLNEEDHVDGKGPNWGPDDFMIYKGVPALMRVIEGAVAYQDEEYSSLVETMNEKARWVLDQQMVYDRSMRSLMKFQNAALTYRNVNRVVVTGKSKKDVYGTDVWMKSAHRSEVDSVGYRYLGDEVFELNGKMVANEYVPGGASAAGKGERLSEGSVIYQTLIRLYTDSDLEQLRSYLRFLKFTGDKPTSYCVLWSTARGVGKGWFADLAASLLGNAHVMRVKADLLAGLYNVNTVNCRLLVANEFKASSKANKSMALEYLKNYVGDEIISVRAMHRNPYQAEVRAGLIITVNDKGDMPSDGLGDRRQWYVEGAAGARERGLELWKGDEWLPAWKALKDPEEMGRFAQWVSEGAIIDFKTWRPPVTVERTEDLMEGMSGVVQIAYEVLCEARGKSVDVLSGKSIRQLMLRKMEGQEIYVVGRAFGKMLREAGWWTSKDYAETVDNGVAAWFTLVPTLNSHRPSEMTQLASNGATTMGLKY